MKLATMTWPEAEAASRDLVVLIPTGSLEQHGAHLPLFTDSLIVTAVAEGVESKIPESVLLTPTLWLGASGHHLKFPGSLSASFQSYQGQIVSIVNSLAPHGFHKFFVLNGHGGNNEINGIALRELKAANPNATFGHAGYYSYIEAEIAAALKGPLKGMNHACEAETSLIMFLRPDLVRADMLRDDGMVAEPAIQGLVHQFDEITEAGSYGYATLGNADTGRVLFDAAVAKVSVQLEALANGYCLREIQPRE